MERQCKAILETLVEVSGDLDRLGEPERRHVEECASCRSIAGAELRLDRILTTAVPPADPAIVSRVMASLRPVRVRRRLAALVPVAASLLLALVGAVMLGGVPGSGVLAQLPAVSSQAWLTLATAVSDWGVAMTTAAGAAKLTLSPVVPVLALLVGLAGLAGVVAAARRWQALAPWRRED